MADIKTILFDVGGVLLTNGWDHLERATVLEHFSVDRDSYEQRHDLANDAWEKGFMSVEQFLERTVFFTPRRFTPAEFLEQMRAQSQVLPQGAISTLTALRASGHVRLAVLNNEARELNDYRIERFQLRKYFEAFFSSCYLGMRKPDPNIFALALNVLRTTAAETAFVDDRQENCAAAQRLGIHAIRYQDESQFGQELDLLGISSGVR